jgi:hypothetical protein
LYFLQNIFIWIESGVVAASRNRWRRVIYSLGREISCRAYFGSLKKALSCAVFYNAGDNEIALEFGIHPVQVGQWKKEIQDHAKTLFKGKCSCE